jgi:hypothetical protein
MPVKPKPRTITVGSLFQARRGNHHVLAPSIRLIGLWLSRAGFKPGAKVEAAVMNGIITLTLLRDSDADRSQQGELF